MRKLREIPPSEIQLHNSSSDAWIIIKGIVYDITKFLPIHPGGDGILLPLLGQDATQEYEDVGHSIKANNLLPPMAIGRANQVDLNIPHSNDSCFNKLENNSQSNPSMLSAPTLTMTPKSTMSLNSSLRERGKRVPECEDSVDGTSPSYVPESSVIDLTKPLIQQVYNLSLPEYCKLTQEKIYNPESYRMFSNDILESLSRTRWFVIPLVWLPISCICMHRGISLLSAYDFHLLLFLLLWFSGVLLWTLFEYIFHRFLFHYAEQFLPDCGTAFVIHFAAHAIHHTFPMDRLRLVMPPALFCILSSPVFLVSKYALPDAILYSVWSGTSP